jgi:hypothetical protein
MDRRRDDPAGSPRISGVIVIDDVGLEVPSHPMVDFLSLTMDEVFRLSCHNPEPCSIDAGALPPEALAVMTSNRVALAI